MLQPCGKRFHAPGSAAPAVFPASLENGLCRYLSDLSGVRFIAVPQTWQKPSEQIAFPTVLLPADSEAARTAERYCPPSVRVDARKPQRCES